MNEEPTDVVNKHYEVGFYYFTSLSVFLFAVLA